MVSSIAEPYTCVLLSESDFDSVQAQWDALNSSSGGAIFTSWAWMHTWWKLFKEPDFELVLVGVYQGAMLVGLAPCYSSSTRFLKVLRARRLMFLGDKVSGESGFRSEYLGFICQPTHRAPIEPLLFEYLLTQAGADELALRDVPDSKAFQSRLQSIGQNKSVYIRETARDQTYRIDTSGDYATYLASLGKGSRSRIQNSQKRLMKHGDVTVERFNGGNLEEHLGLIQRLHEGRWNNRAQFSAFIKFLDAFPALAASGVVIRFNGDLVAATLNVEYQGTVCNLMLGFVDPGVKRVSMGYAALGYDLAFYFGASSVGCYDLLAGEGKQTNYKASIAAEGPVLVSNSLHVNILTRTIYRLYDVFKR